MTKTLPAVITASALLLGAQIAHSDILGIYAGGGIWQTSHDGEVGTDDDPLTTNELGFDDETNTFYYVAFEHPVPVLPNVRLAMNSLEITGDETITRDLSVAIDTDFSVPAGANLRSDIELDFIDYTLYYEILDNYVSLDVGLTARQFDGTAEFSYEIDNGEGGTASDSTSKDLDFVIPMLYGKVQLDLPLTGWYVGGNANIISYDDNTVSDIEAKVGYMTSGLGLDIGFDLGFRRLVVETDPDDSDDITVNLTLDGPFASVFVHF